MLQISGRNPLHQVEDLKRVAHFSIGNVSWKDAVVTVTAGDSAQRRRRRKEYFGHSLSSQ